MRATKKVRLNLTIQRQFKDLARQIARIRRRSISALFEDLIEAEIERIKAKSKSDT